MKFELTHRDRRTMPFFCLVAALLLTAAPAWSALVTGVVINGLNGEPVRGADVTVEGSETTGVSDLDGLAMIDLAPGTYTIMVSKDGYTTQKIIDVAVTGDGGNFAAVLDPVGEAAKEESTTITDEIVITAEATAASATALLTERKNAAQISDSMGIEEMSKSGGGDAGAVLKRVTGVSLQDGKYIYVRGLGDRYSNTTLNGSKIPSTEFERKVVPMDLFPTGMIEKITVSKSYTADKPGDFAAGLVELETVDFPSQRNMKLGLSFGQNSETTGDPYRTYLGGLSFSGNGGQPLPASIPNEALVPASIITGEGFTREELETIGESIGGVWQPTLENDAPLKESFSLSYGETFGRFGLVLSANYENGFQNRDEVANIFSATADGGVTPQNTYEFEETDEKVRQAITTNLAYRIGNNHHVQAKGLFTSLARSEARELNGFFQDIANNVRDNRISYRDQEISSIQLSGTSYFDGIGDGGLLEWRASTSTAETAENRRQLLYEEFRPGEFRLTDNAQSGFLYFNDLEDDLTDYRLDWQSFFNTANPLTLKVGAALTDNERAFDGRRLRFFQRGTSGIDLTLSADELFVPEFIDPRGFEIQEITRATDTYDGDHEVVAGYVQADYAFGDWRLIAGVRVEDSDQQVITQDRNNPNNTPIVSEIVNTDVLPALNLVYAMSERTNLRFSASKTVNRPEYRELAPFKFTHVAGGYAVTGNPDLVRAEITSVDVRWEFFPAAGEVIAASVFFKDFTDPIENVLLAGAERLESFANVESARNIGAEFELRQNLGRYSESLENFSMVFNYAFVDSEITIGDELTLPLTNDKRSLVGQPDNVFNAIFEWNQPKWGSLVRVLYNFIDDKVAQAGGFGLPDVIEESRDTLDVVYSQALGRGFDLKLSGTNLTDQERLWTQGGETFRLYNPGRTFGLSFSYKPF